MRLAMQVNEFAACARAPRGGGGDVSEGLHLHVLRKHNDVDLEAV